MSAIIFISQEVPEKNFVKGMKYKAYLSPQEKQKILEELRISVPDLDDYIVTMHVDIDLKQYDTKNTRV